MQIIIPMSGFGERFRRVGYTVPKPLIEMEGKPIIAHVIEMFPGETDFLFICNQDHLDEPTFRMAEILQQYCPTGKIVGIPPHKLGPVNAVLQVQKHIDPAKKTIVNYCDFTCYWDWQDFKKFVAETGCDGAIPAYRGFHPHTLGNTYYAYMQETDGWLTDIQEKQPYTDNRMEEYASSGTYYFASGAMMLQSLKDAVSKDLKTGAEYFVSLPYKLLLAEGQKVAVYDLQHFMQWGTPQDVAEYNGWSTAFHKLIQPEMAITPMGSTVIPMAGLGSRFKTEGYALTKPLIPVSGKPMVLQAKADLPPATETVYVMRQDMPQQDDIVRTITATDPTSHIAYVPEVTEGQACTAKIGVEALSNTDGPITIGACDNGAIYDQAKLQALLDDNNIDVIVWGVRGYVTAMRRPETSGWILVDDHDTITGAAVKEEPATGVETTPAIIGTFTFRNAEIFQQVTERLFARNGRVNGEFYLDSCVEDALALGLSCKLFPVEHFLCWGTPNDLKTFQYWQSCFDKWEGHPYSLEQDRRVAPSAIPALRQEYAKTIPARPVQERALISA